MVGEQHFRLDDSRCVDTLIDGHRVGLVARQEGDVDILQVGHLGDVLRIAGDVDAQTVEGEDITVVTPLGVELLMVGCRVVGRHGLDGDISGILYLVAVTHHESVLKVSEDGLVHVDRRGWSAYLVDGLTVEVILVLVGQIEVANKQ